MLLGFRFGIADAKQAKMPFIRRLLTSGERWKVFRQSIREAILPLALAFVIDAVVQYMLLRSIRPVAAVVVGALLVWLPFVVARSLANRAWMYGHERGRQLPEGRSR